jgi:DNA repair protein RadC
MLNASHSGALALSKDIHSRAGANRLWDSNNHLVLPNDRATCDRHMAPSGTGEKLRVRQALERLLSLIEPEEMAFADAKRLLLKFGSLGGVLEAATHQPDSGPANRLLNAVHQLTEELSRTGLAALPDLSSAESVCRYLSITMGDAPVEQIRVLFLNASNHLLHDEVMNRGSAKSTHTCMREIIRIALLRNATGLILAHNHPCGDPRPSAQDIMVTKQIISTAHELDIIVHDHLIISRSGWVSMRGMGLLS